ncbi:hypothetical protein R3I94_009019 [Phoxinus phoxinus]
MFSVWTLSSLILSYTLAFPIFNNTSVSHKEISPNITERNSTEYIKTNPTNGSETGIRKRPSIFLRRCFLSTCAMGNLGSMLQTGDEIAGDMTDPMGIGKK